MIAWLFRISLVSLFALIVACKRNYLDPAIAISSDLLLDNSIFLTT